MGEVAVPSSMIFVGLVVIWLLILVPAVARRRQEVARPSVTALSGRVLERTPRRDPDAYRAPAVGRNVEVDVRHELEPAHAVATRTEPEARSRSASPAAGTGSRGRDLDKLAGWTWRDAEESEPGPAVAADRARTADRPPEPSRYRPGRGGYDPHTAALAARTRYAFRQRMVVLLLILAVGTAAAAVFVGPQLWWGHGGVDLVLVGYLTYLRRQVRVEEAIRRRRIARAGVPRRTPDVDDAAEPRVPAAPAPSRPRPPRRAPVEDLDHKPADDQDAESPTEPPDRRPEPGPADRPTGRSTSAAAKAAETVDTPPALPRLQPFPTPPVPVGMTLVEGEEDDPALHELDSVSRPDYRRASGQ